MAAQIGLFEPRPPAVRSSPTSVAAAEAIRSDAKSLRAKLYAWLRVNGPATDEEMQAVLPPNTQRPRRVELVRAGLVVDSGQTKPGKSGRQATLWAVAP